MNHLEAQTSSSSAGANSRVASSSDLMSMAWAGGREGRQWGGGEQSNESLNYARSVLQRTDCLRHIHLHGKGAECKMPGTNCHVSRGGG